MNIIVIISLMALLVGSMFIALDHHSYHQATVALLEKKIKKDYENE